MKITLKVIYLLDREVVVIGGGCDPGGLLMYIYISRSEQGGYISREWFICQAPRNLGVKPPSLIGQQTLRLLNPSIRLRLILSRP